MRTIENKKIKGTIYRIVQEIKNGELVIREITDIVNITYLDLLIEAVNIPPAHGFTTVKSMDDHLRVLDLLEKTDKKESVFEVSEADLAFIKNKVNTFSVNVLNRDLRDWKQYFDSLSVE